MMLMMLAKEASIISSIILTQFSNLRLCGPGLASGLVFKNVCAHNAFWGVFGDPENLQ